LNVGIFVQEFDESLEAGNDARQTVKQALGHLIFSSHLLGLPFDVL
jgi:hypothetical protein